MALYVFAQDQIALVAATAKSVLELGTASTGRIRIVEWWVDFDGVTATAIPVKVEVGHFSAAVTTATTGTVDKLDTADAAAATVVKHSTTVEGAGTIDAGAVNHRISPTSGYHYIAPLGRERIVAVSTFWRMRLTAAAGVNATVGVIIEE